MRHSVIGKAMSSRAVLAGFAAGLVCLSLVGVSAAPGAQAQEVGGEETEFTTGTGRAEAKYLKVGPSRGSLALAPMVGLALSDFLGVRGRGEVRSVDLGILADFLPPELVGVFPALKVESSEEDSEKGRTTSIGTPADLPVGASVGDLRAEAGDAPYGRSSFTAAPVELGLVGVGGGVSETFAGVVDGNTREAESNVTIGRVELAGGIVALEGLEWRAVHRTGAQTTEEAAFTVGSVVVAGQRFAVPAGAEQPLKDALAAAAPILKPLGIQILLPEPRIEGGIVEMTPLRIRVADSQLNIVVAPVLDGIQPVREAIIDGLRSASEDVDIAILLADVALGVVAGGSSLDIEVGGANARTAASAEMFEFASFDLPDVPTASVGASSSPLGSPVRGSSAGGSSLPPGATTATPPGSAEGTTPQGSSGSESAAAPDARLASSPGSDATSGGPLLAVGLATLAAAGAAGVLDYRRMQREARPV